MATEITGYLMFSKTSLNSFIFNRDIEHIISLDEGHDRPSWEWVRSGRSRRIASGAWVPEMPATILRDGLLMVLVEGLKDEIAISAIASRGSSRSGVVDLNHIPASAEVYENFASAFESYEITVIAFPGSSIASQVAPYIDAGLKIIVFEERTIANGVMDG